VNAINRKGNTPLHVAAMWRNIMLYDMLVENGGDPTLANLDHRTPFEFMHVRAPLLRVCGRQQG
jgi:ankyrin repeat protein